MDALDKEMIGLLQLNARESLSSLARKLKTSRSTIQDRLSRLERNDIIQGYTIRLDENIHNNDIRAFVTVSLKPQQTSIILAEMKTIYSIRSIHTVSGKFDLMVEVETKTTQEMDEILDKISAISGVIKTESSIILSTRLQR